MELEPVENIIFNTATGVIYHTLVTKLFVVTVAAINCVTHTSSFSLTYNCANHIICSKRKGWSFRHQRVTQKNLFFKGERDAITISVA